MTGQETTDYLTKLLEEGDPMPDPDEDDDTWQDTALKNREI